MRGVPTSPEDLGRVSDLFACVTGTVEPPRVLTVPGVPYSKSRPQFGKMGAYSKAADVKAEQSLGWLLKTATPEPFTGNVALVCLFFRGNRTTVDADNLLKHVCDAANKVLWLDDSQCTATLGVIEMDRDNPRTVVAVGPHVSSLQRGTDYVAAARKSAPRKRNPRPGSQPSLLGLS